MPNNFSSQWLCQVAHFISWLEIIMFLRKPSKIDGRKLYGAPASTAKGHFLDFLFFGVVIGIAVEIIVARLMRR